MASSSQDNDEEKRRKKKEHRLQKEKKREKKELKKRLRESLSSGSSIQMNNGKQKRAKIEDEIIATPIIKDEGNNNENHDVKMTPSPHIKTQSKTEVHDEDYDDNDDNDVTMDTPKRTPTDTPARTPKDTPKGTPKGTPKDTPKLATKTPIMKNGSEVKIKVIKPSQSKDTAPYVISFPSGVPTITTKSPAFTCTSHTSKSIAGSVRGKIIQGQDNTCSYSTPFLPPTSSKTSTSSSSSKLRKQKGPLTKLMLGIYDKQTNTLTLHLSAENGKILPVRQTLLKHMNNNNNSDEDSNAHNEHLSMENLTAWEKKRVLYESFGSARMKKELKQKDSNRVDASAIVGTEANMLNAVHNQNLSQSNKDAMKEAAQKAKEKGVDDTPTSSAIAKSYAEARKAFLPPFNTNATKPHLIYNFQRICDATSWDQISRSVTACIYKGKDSKVKKEHKANNNDDDDDDDDDANKNESWVSAITSRGGTWTEPILDVLKSIQDPTYNKQRIKFILLLHHMINCYHYFARDKFSSAKNITVERLAGRMRIPRDVAPRLLELFTTPLHSQSNHNAADDKNGTSSYSMDTQHKNKLLAHILLLYIVAHGNEMKVGSINRLVTMLHLSMNVACNLLRQAGCKILKKTNGTVAVSLNAPLTFPPPKKVKR